MTEQRRIFIDEYILCGSATEAARRANYKFPNRQGYALLNTPEIRAAIDEQLEKVKTEKVLEQQSLLEYLSSVVRGDERDEQIVTRLIGKGCSVIERHELRTSTRDRLKAAELLLKVYGAFDKPEEKDGGAADLLTSTLEKIWQKKNDVA